MIILKKCGEIEYGINDDGNLFLGNKTSGYNLPDTKENRAKIEKDFERYTKEDHKTC